MAQVNIGTSQNVQIEYATADVGSRILSHILDSLILMCYMGIIFLISDQFKLNSMAIIIIVMLPVFFYSFITESIFQGQSFGKMILKIKVIKLDGSQAGMLSYFIRWIFRLIDISLSYGLIATIIVAVSNKGQRLGDMAAGTTVINLKKKQTFQHSIYKKLPDNYKLQYPEVELLSETDIKTISEVLKTHKLNPSIKTLEIMKKTKNAVQSKIVVESTQSDYNFLKTIITDYNYVLRNDEY